ncbi:MAG: HEAT repeat domain-containing protein [Bradymonadales bacterium]|jgi:tetratricopeptide (TPR) repeat protein
MLIHTLAKRSILFLFAFFVVGIANFASAQDDWLADDPQYEQRKIERYQQLVDRSPQESYAFMQMMKAVGKGAEYDALKQNYEQKVAKSPKNFNLRMILGHIHKYGNNTAQALDSYREAAKIQENALVYESIGAAEEESKDLQSAEQSYAKALTMSKDKAQKERILRALASMALHRRQMQQAQAYFSQLIALEPKSLFLRKELAQLYVENKLYDEALGQLEEAEKLAGADAQARLQIRLERGQILELQGKEDEAIALYQAEAKKQSSQHWIQREVAYRIVEINRRMGRLDKTLDELTKLWTKPSYDQYLLLADLNDELGHRDVAADLLRKAIAAQPRSAEARIKYIAMMQAQGNEKEFRKAYAELIKIQPTNVEYRLKYADELFKQKSDADALRVLKQARSDFRADGDALLRIADKYLEYQKTEEARALYLERLKAAPHDIDAIEALGVLYALEGRLSEAQKTWKRIENTRLSQAEKREVLGRIYAEHALYEQAKALYSQSLKNNPNDCESKRQLADLHERSRNYSLALAEWEDITRRCPQLVLKREANRRIVAIYKAQGVLGTKLQEFEEAFQKDPKQLEEGFFLADAFLQDNKPEGAIRVLEAMNAASPKNDDVLFALADVYAQQRDFAKIKSALVEVIDNNSPQKREAILTLAEYAYTHGEVLEAEQWYLAALNLNANDAPTHAKLAQLYQRTKQEDKAIYYAETALNIDPRAFDTALQLASLYTMNGQYDEADKQYLNIIMNANDEALIQKAGMRSIDYHEFRQSLELLEKNIYPATRRLPRKAVYDLLMLRLCDAQAQPHILSLRSGDASRAAVARHALRELGQRFSNTIVSALQSDNLTHRGLAMRILPYLSISNAVPVLERFMQQNDRRIQIEAMLAIAFSQLPSAIDVLHKYTASRYDRRIREIATWGLGLIQSPAATAHLAEISQLNIDSLRAIAAIGLGRQGDELARIAQMLESDPSNSVKQAAAWALGYQQVQSALPQILKLLQSVPNAAPVALWAAARFDTAQSTQAILDALWASKNMNENLRPLAAKLIRQKEKQKKFRNLTQWENNKSFITSMQDNERSLYLNALDYVALLNAFVNEDLKDIDNKPAKFFAANIDAIRAHAQNTAKTGDESALLYMLQDLSTASPARMDKLEGDGAEQRKHVAMAIVDDLARFMQSPNLSIQLHAAKLAGQMAHTPLLPALIKTARDAQNPAVRSEAILSLAHFNDATAEAELLKFATDPHFIIRGAAISALGKHKSEQSQAMLRNALADPFTDVASIAAQALGEQRAQDSKNALLKAYARNTPQLQLAVINALEQLGANNEIKSLTSDDARVMAKIRSYAQ